ncbi:MAG: redoxin domain-containing protein [Pirellulales bacterium]|nr:redoxin domain-containing protein [Pirellulales bacterium]
MLALFRWQLIATAIIADLAFSTTQPAPAAEASHIGLQAPAFELRDYRGKVHKLDDYQESDILVLAFLGNDCPLAKLYSPRLAQLATEFAPRGVTFLGVNSNRQDAVSEIAAHARDHGIEFPILKDVGNVLADQLQAERTPEVFVLDRERKVRYHGRIDDQYGFQPNGIAYHLAAPRSRDLANALGELLDGKQVTVPEKDAPGCLIGRTRQPSAASDVTYANQIARIMNANCVFCHRDGQIAPFPLTTYEEVVGWAEMIGEVVETQRMPPWHADPRHGDFVNDARLADEDKDLIARWVAAGAPEGNRSELPEPPQFAEGWMMPEPDEIIYMDEKPYTVPAEGTVPYERFVIDPGWQEDRWISAIEPRPGNPSVVHHIVMYIMPPKGPKKGAAGKLRNDWLAAYAPGLRPQVLPEGWARYFPAGAKLIFELHYTPNGVEQTDRSYLGIKFANPASVKREVATKQAGNFTFKIPPHADNHEVKSEFEFREDSILWSVSPHMHVRGKDFLYELLYPDGKRETVLSVPNYDFGWQTTYVFKEPKILPRGTVMHCTAHFDNSEHNLNNPDPSKEVRWGEQTWEEMMFGWFEMALVDQDLTKPQPPPVARSEEFRTRWAHEAPQLDQQTRESSYRALAKDEEFRFFSYFVAQTAPQLDRVCVTYVEEDKLRPFVVTEINEFETTLRNAANVMKADGQALAAAAAGDEVVVYDDLTQAPGSIMSRMVRKGVQSSMHVPVTVRGKRGTVNFWSSEPDAFPPQAVEYLSEVGRLLDDSQQKNE